MALVESDMGKPVGAFKKHTDKLINECLESFEDLKCLNLDEIKHMEIPIVIFRKIKARVE